MQGPQVEYVPEFADGEALLGVVATVLGESGRTLSTVREPWPVALEALRAQLEQRCGHPITECIAEHHALTVPDLSRRAVEPDKLAPNSFVAIVSGGVARTIHFTSFTDYRVTSERRLESGSLLLINERSLRRWRPMLPAWAKGGPNARVYFRYALTSPQGPGPDPSGRSRG